MSRRVDAPQTTNADTPRADLLRAVARECVAHFPHDVDECRLQQALPHSDANTITTVEHITGKTVDLSGPGNLPARLRAELRRWAMRDQLKGTTRG